MELHYLRAADLDLAVDDPLLDAQNIRLVDPRPVIDHVQARFGFPPSLFDDLIIFQANTKLLRATAPPLQLTAAPSIDRLGVDFLRIDMANPRMTTSATMTWGRFATQNFVDTTVDQCTAYLRREQITLSAEQRQRCTGRGFVVVRHAWHGLGVGFLETTDADDERCGHMRSMYPRAYAVDLELTSPFGNPQ